VLLEISSDQEWTAMPKELALFLCFMFILWLFAKDEKLRPMTSWGLWVVLPWIMIIGSRSVSLWFDTGGREDVSLENYLEGSPLERNIYLFLFVVAAVIIWQRRLDWHRVFNLNPWFFAFFIYCGISVIWSDYPLVSFKRWIKELVNLFMVLIILSEEQPVQAIRAVFARYIYFAIPLSVALIIFYPDVGMHFKPKIMEYSYVGVTTHKNILGSITLISGLFLIWDLILLRSGSDGEPDKADICSRCVLLLMAVWLIYVSQSITAILCLVLGTVILLFFRPPYFMRQVKYLGVYSLVLGILLILLYTFPGSLDAFAGILGRDTTFTGRTGLWADLMRENINPIFGTGYNSFWLGDRVEYLWESYSFQPIQAHNGYLEVYLNGGLVGLFLLMVTIILTGSKLRKGMLLGHNFAVLLFSFLAVAVFYNLTEARFGGQDLLWVIMIVAALYAPDLFESMPENSDSCLLDDPAGTIPEET
jgi:exopolysaccharide production protein ExoQ